MSHDGDVDGLRMVEPGEELERTSKLYALTCYLIIFICLCGFWGGIAVLIWYLS